MVRDLGSRPRFCTSVLAMETGISSRYALARGCLLARAEENKDPRISWEIVAHFVQEARAKQSPA